jgi:hypothetical protein
MLYDGTANTKAGRGDYPAIRRLSSRGKVFLSLASVLCGVTVRTHRLVGVGSTKDVERLWSCEMLYHMSDRSTDWLMIW